MMYNLYYKPHFEFTQWPVPGISSTSRSASIQKINFTINERNRIQQKMRWNRRHEPHFMQATQSSSSINQDVNMLFANEIQAYAVV